MKYHAPTNQFTISADDLKMACHSLLWSIKHIRQGHNLDLKGYKRSGPMEDPDFAESAILQAAKYLGIDLGSDREGQIDVSNEG